MTPLNPRSVMVVDDHPLVRAALAELLAREEDLGVCAQAGSATEAMALAAQCRPELATVDLSLAGGTGLRLIRQLRTCCPAMKILVFSMHEESAFGARALRAGADGYVEKGAPPERVLEAVRAVLGGRRHFRKIAARALPGTPQRQPAELADLLTERELEIFEALGRGESAREVAAGLCRSVKTVETHCANIRRKLGLGSGSALRALAIRWTVENR